MELGSSDDAYSHVFQFAMLHSIICFTDRVLNCQIAVGLLSSENIDVERLSTVLWYPAGGYACYLVEVGTHFVDVPARYEKVLKVGPPRQRSDPLRLRWVPIETLRTFIRSAASPPQF